jgi:hypothetical protein
VVEATVFKDGHVLVRQEANVRAQRGEFLLEGLSAPITGSYHPYVRSPNQRVQSVVVSRATSKKSTPIGNLYELLSLNVGAKLTLVETDGKQWSGELVAAPDTGDPNGPAPGATLFQSGTARAVLLKTDAGHRIVPVQRIRSFQFSGPFRTAGTTTSEQVSLRVRLDPPSSAQATIGASYLQKGIRWAASYRIELDPRGEAEAHLLGTVVNELANLDGTDLRLVMGRPRIFNADVVDPIAIRDSAAPLSRRFQQVPGAQFFGGFGGGAFGGGRFCGGGAGAVLPSDEEPADAGSPTSSPRGNAQEGVVELSPGLEEDLFYLPARRITLRKGDTAVLPLSSSRLKVADIYTADIPFQPVEDPERARGLTEDQKRELSDELRQVRARHLLQFTNTSAVPLTTAPASIFQDGRLVAHTLINYVPPGGSGVCVLGEAPGIRVKHVDNEELRVDVPASKETRDNSYTRVELAGTVTVENQSPRRVRLMVTRSVPGNVDHATGGQLTQLEATDMAARGQNARPWVNRLTGSARIAWQFELAPGEKRELRYNWHAYQL